MQAWARRVIAWWLDDGFDLLLTPTPAEPPPVLGDLTHPETGGARLLPFVIFTAPFNVTGQPAMSVPLAQSASGLPVGVQLVGAPYREDLLFRVAGQLEHVTAVGRPPPARARVATVVPRSHCMADASSTQPRRPSSSGRARRRRSSSSTTRSRASRS